MFLGFSFSSSAILYHIDALSELEKLSGVWTGGFYLAISLFLTKTYYYEPGTSSWICIWSLLLNVRLPLTTTRTRALKTVEHVPPLFITPPENTSQPLPCLQSRTHLLPYL